MTDCLYGGLQPTSSPSTRRLGGGLTPTLLLFLVGPVEFVTRERYVLLRSDRIFADLVIMPAAIRLAIHLPRQAKHPLFIKIASDRKHVTHVAKLHDVGELEAMKPFLREAYEYSISY